MKENKTETFISMLLLIITFFFIGHNVGKHTDKEFNKPLRPDTLITKHINKIDTVYHYNL